MANKYKYAPPKREISVKSPKLYPWQVRVCKLYNRFPRNSFISVLSPRQRGKSFTLKILALMAALNKRNFKVFIVTPTFALAGKAYKELAKTCKQIPYLVSSANASTYTLEFSNGSSINLKSIEQGDNLRGFTANLVIIDEAAFCNVDVVESCVLPWTNTTSGDVILFSTPRFKTDRDLFYKYYSKGDQDEKKGYYSVDWKKWDTSALLPHEKLQQYRESLPWKIFENEIVGNFLDLEGSVFGDFSKVLSPNFNINDKDYYMGVDFGTGDGSDYTSITIFNSLRQMVFIKYFNDKTPTDSVKEIVKIMKEYKPKVASFEINSIGSIYWDMLVNELKRQGIRPTLNKFTTTNESKRKIIEKLATAIEAGDIQLLDDKELCTEMTVFEMQKTKSGREITYNAPSGYKDDLILSTCIALNSMTVSHYAIR